jgi:hypothetical protein
MSTRGRKTKEEPARRNRKTLQRQHCWRSRPSRKTSPRRAYHRPGAAASPSRRRSVSLTESCHATPHHAACYLQAAAPGRSPGAVAPSPHATPRRATPTPRHATPRQRRANAAPRHAAPRPHNVPACAYLRQPGSTGAHACFSFPASASTVSAATAATAAAAAPATTVLAGGSGAALLPLPLPLPAPAAPFLEGLPGLLPSSVKEAEGEPDGEPSSSEPMTCGGKGRRRVSHAACLCSSRGGSTRRGSVGLPGAARSSRTARPSAGRGASARAHALQALLAPRRALTLRRLHLHVQLHGRADPQEAHASEADADEGQCRSDGAHAQQDGLRRGRRVWGRECGGV